MVKELTYTVTNNVIMSWEQIRRMKNYQQVVGVKLFHKLFTLCKEAKPLFGFPFDMDLSSTAQSKRFLIHAVQLIQMIDSTIDMLGPSIDMLTDIMTELGKKHARYGVTSKMFQIMGQCLLQTIEECLTTASSHFIYTPEMKQSWLEVYIALSTDMICARNTN